MTYKEMSDIQLQMEIIRVENLVRHPIKPHTYHQNTKYLEKLKREYKTRCQK